MKVIIEIGPNRATKFLGRIRNALKGAKNGLKSGWREGQPPKSRVRATPEKAKAA